MKEPPRISREDEEEIIRQYEIGKKKKPQISKAQIKELAHQLYLCGMNNIPERLFDEYFERNYKEVFEK